MKKTLALEELAMLVAAIYFMTTVHLGINPWWYALLFFIPDVSTLGYAVNTKVGALSYNIFHHKGIAIAVAFLGLHLSNDHLLLAGYILFGHSSFDRVMGYGLKYPDSFQHTHLGTMAEKRI